MTAIDPTTIEKALCQRLAAAVGFLEALVRINSFTANADGVNENGRRIAEQFAPLGFSSRRVPCAVGGAGDHLVLDSGGDGPVIACISHLDTVYSAEEEARHAFAWQPDGDRIYGPGATDIKGGTAMLWLTLEAMAACDPAAFRRARWILLFNAAEEVLTPDFRDLCLRALPSSTRACLVFEGDGKTSALDRDGAPAGFAVGKARKGSGQFRIRVSGRGAHSGGRYAEGANAIHQLARVIDRVMAWTDLDRGTTVNVGIVRGGSVTNRVPHEAEARLEVRGFDQAHYAQVRGHLLGLTGPGEIKAIADGFACRISVQLEKESPPWPENPGTESLIGVWRRAAAACGQRLDATRRGGLSDGNWLWNHFPTIDGLGPRGDNLHASERSPDGSKLPEYVDVTSFVPKALINCLAIRELLG